MCEKLERHSRTFAQIPESGMNSAKREKLKIILPNCGLIDQDYLHVMCFWGKWENTVELMGWLVQILSTERPRKPWSRSDGVQHLPLLSSVVLEERYVLGSEPKWRAGRDATAIPPRLSGPGISRPYSYYMKVFQNYT